MKPRHSSPSAFTTATPTIAATAKRSTQTDLDRFDSGAYSSEEREAEADALAADLVQSLSEVLLLQDRRWRPQQHAGTDTESPPHGTEKKSPPRETDASSLPQGTGVVEAEAAAWRNSLWKELGGPLFFDDALVGATESAGALTGAAAGADSDTLAATMALPAALTAERGGRQSLRGDGVTQGDAMAAAAAMAGKVMAEGFPGENREALGSRVLVAEEPVPDFVEEGGVVAAACAESGGGGEADFLKIDSVWMNIALTFVCVVCAGLAAGLTMGLLSIEPLEMAIKQRSGEWAQGSVLVVSRPRGCRR